MSDLMETTTWIIFGCHISLRFHTIFSDDLELVATKDSYMYFDNYNAQAVYV